MSCPINILPFSAPERDDRPGTRAPDWPSPIQASVTPLGARPDAPEGSLAANAMLRYGPWQGLPLPADRALPGIRCEALNGRIFMGQDTKR